MRREPLDVLIVDDQPGVRYLLDILVREAGHRVFTAQNGLEAVEMTRSIHPDLIFMDVRMPMMGGLEALGHIKDIVPAADVVIMTAYDSEETVSEALQKGALCCISKPFDVEKMKEMIAGFNWKHSKPPVSTAGGYAF